MTPQVHIQSEKIDGYAAVTKDFLAKILRMNADQVLVTDLSTLGDFCHQGDCPEHEGLSHQEIVKAWDAWAADKIEQVYGVANARPNELLTDLFDRILACNAKKAAVSA